jgi:N-acyl-D-aspartate/D-glutamate deacylase
LPLFSTGGRWRLQRVVKLGERLRFIFGWHIFVGLDPRDLRSNDGFTADIRLGHGIETRQDNRNVVATSVYSS